MLPLSWIYHPGTGLPKLTCKDFLLFSGRSFLCYGEIVGKCSENEFVELLNECYEGGFMIRGCSSALAERFSKYGDVVCLGASAEIDLVAHSPSASLSKLAKRGSRQVWVHEYSDIQSQISLLAKIRPLTRHAILPQLLHLFRTSVGANIRLFGACDSAGEPLGVITLSTRAPGHLHSELLLRADSAPVGVMEYLLQVIIEKLYAEGNTILSLGEVPFVPSTGNNPRVLRNSYLETVVRSASGLLNPSYNVQGLFNFKDKFCPTWVPVYWCGVPSLSLFDLGEIAVRTRTARVIKSAIQRRMSSFLAPARLMSRPYDRHHLCETRPRS